MKYNLLILGCLLLFAGIAGSAAAAPKKHTLHHHHRHHKGEKSAEQITLDLTPIVVLPYVVPEAANDPVQAGFLRRMNLENGVEVRGTRGIKSEEVTTRNLFILSVTQSLEGGFDSVNLYDKGVLSWGVMQWTAATGSLPPALIYIKRRLMQTGQKRVWDKVFAAQGLDVDSRGLIAFGKPLHSETDIRLAFRGTVIPGRYDPKVAGYWATVMARAGRQPAIEQFQREYAQQIVDRVLTQPLPGVLHHAPGHETITVAALTGGDPYAQALVFALWTNNPRHAREYVGDAARAVRAVSHSDDPLEWKEGAFRQCLIQRCRISHFSNWKQRGQLVAERVYALRTSAPKALTPYECGRQTALIARKQQLLLLASRHKTFPASRTAALKQARSAP